MASARSAPAPPAPADADLRDRRARPAPACPPPRFRQRTGTPVSSRSTGAGRTSTMTVALCGVSSRTAASATPTVTTSRTRSRLPAMSPARSSLGELAHAALGPDDLDRRRLGRHAGRSTNPGAGSPCDDRHDRHDAGRRLLELERHRRRHDLRDLDAERRPHFVVAQVEQPRARAAPVARSSTATISPGSSRLSSADEPRSRTSTVAGGSPTISSCGGMFRNSSGTRMLRSTTCSPATVSQSSVASAIASIFSPRCRNGWYAIDVDVVRPASPRRPASRRCMISVRSRSRSSSARQPALDRGRRAPARSVPSPRTRRPPPRRSPRSGRSRRDAACRARG